MKSPEFKTIKNQFNRLYSRYQRRSIAEQTKACFKEILRNEQHGIPVTEGIKNTTFYTNTFPLNFTLNPLTVKSNATFETVIRMHDEDTLDTALKLQDQGYNPCVLNFASPSRPGGGWLSGARAQEEELFLRSTYDLSLSDPDGIDTERKWTYPIPEKGGIYSPDVLVFRNNESSDYTILPWDKCRYVNFVAVAALRNPKTDNGRLSRRDAFVTKEKIKTILRIALINGHTCVLLGAFGCGAFSNPPHHMAELFAETFH